MLSCCNFTIVGLTGLSKSVVMEEIRQNSQGYVHVKNVEERHFVQQKIYTMIPLTIKCK